MHITSASIAFGVVAFGGAASATEKDKPELALFSVGAPAGFDDLAGPQRAIVDVYFGGRRVGQAEVSFQPGHLTFVDPAAVAAMIPDILDLNAVTAALAAQSLETHPSLVCGDTGDARTCGKLDPQVAGVIFDQDNFRVSLFINARLLKIRAASDPTYLPTPEASLSLMDSVAGTLAGGTGSGTVYAFQNRAVIGDRDARLISTSTYATGSGFKADLLVGQVDKPGMRYSAGVFWAPGLDLVGRRKMLGVGVETQLDTRFDKDLINGSPLVIALTQRSRVDILIDGRLTSTRIYEAGNQALDTSALPDGSYDVVLHIQEIGGTTRDERRLFTKNPRIAPLGQTLWSARAGVLVDDRMGAFLSPTDIPYAEGGAAMRLTPHLALDGTFVATARKAIAQIGGYLITPVAQFRLGILGSTDGDTGMLFQINSSGQSALNYNVDLRRVRSRDDRPLIPVGEDALYAAFGAGGDIQRAQLAAGTFTQAIADISYHLKRAQVSLSAFYRTEPDRGSTYAIGPTARWSAYRHKGLELTLEANFSKSSFGHSAYAGMRLQFLRSQSAFSATAGMQSISSGGAGKKSSAVGGVQASWQKEDVLGGNLMLAGSYDHTPENDLAHGRADLQSDVGTFAADVVQQTDGPGNTQYSLGFQSSALVSRNMFVLGGREQSESVIAVRIDDAPPGAAFQVLVNETPRGVIRAGATLPIAVPAYRQYGVRIRPEAGNDLFHFDTEAQRVSVYPGNVAKISWSIQRVAAMFGRAIWADGSPVANAGITTGDAIAHTDQNGYFQIETSPEALLAIRSPDGRSCRIRLDGVESKNGYAALGTITCEAAQGTTPPKRIAAN